MSIPKYSLSDLIELMARLRDPDTGCPWDVKQTFLSITPSTIEEAYELVDAIEQGDPHHIKEELGDLLFQVVFYAQLASENREYDFTDIVDLLAQKLLRRHPHVFPDGTLHSVSDGSCRNEGDVKVRWEEIKQRERDAKGLSGLLADVPLNLPALTRAYKLQKRAGSVGFDWPSLSGPLSKIKEELGELESAIEQGDHRHIEAELGDLLFSVVNVSRHLKIDAERSLRTSNARFCQRIDMIEILLADRQQVFSDLNSEELDELWGLAKECLSQKSN